MNEFHSEDIYIAAAAATAADVLLLLIIHRIVGNTVSSLCPYCIPTSSCDNSLSSSASSLSS